ncbi:MAG TPA: TetR/AcrR family transcriptional regulator [Propylenella sp.]
MPAISKPVDGVRRVRMAPDDRERMILEEAVRFFARHGFTAQIREFATEAGISQGLIYRYFRSKRDLVERVYEHNFLKRWDPAWEILLQDRDVSLDDRLRQFYRRYLGAIDDPDWIRLVMYSGLEGNDLTRRYIRNQVEKLLRIIAMECRHACAAEPQPDGIADAELEAVWQLHSTFIYYLVRKHIFGVRTIGDRDALVDVAVADFLHGVGSVLLDQPPERAGRSPRRGVRSLRARRAPDGSDGDGP